MSKWRIWEDHYWGDQWNDRTELSYPQFEGEEIADDEIEDRLMSLFDESCKEFVEIEWCGGSRYATMGYCTKCECPKKVCDCEFADAGEDDDAFSLVGFSAEKVLP